MLIITCECKVGEICLSKQCASDKFMYITHLKYWCSNLKFLYNLTNCSECVIFY